MSSSSLSNHFAAPPEDLDHSDENEEDDASIEEEEEEEEDHPVCIDDIEANLPFIYIPLWRFRNQNHVARFSNALRRIGNSVTLIFSFQRNAFYNTDWPNLDWSPLLQAIESQQKIEKVEFSLFAILSVRPTAHAPRVQTFFQALQRNTYVRSFKLKCFDFSSNNNEDTLISYLDAAASNNSHLEELEFNGCSNGSILLAYALQRYTNLQSLRLMRCDDETFQLLLKNVLQVKKLAYAPKCTYDDIHPAASDLELLQQYLGRSNTQITIFELSNCEFNVHCAFASFLWQQFRGAVIFRNCQITADRAVEQPVVSNNPLGSTTNLHSLRIDNCNCFQNQELMSSLRGVLLQRGSPLRSLDIEFDDGDLSPTVPLFQDLMKAASNSKGLEQLSLGLLFSEFGYGHLEEAVLFSIPMLKVQNFKLCMRPGLLEEEKARLLQVLKSNYTFRTVECTEREVTPITTTTRNIFTDARQSQLEYYLDRNRMLAKWIKNPKLVPCHLWSYALALALKAGANSLYQSLIALSGRGVGLKQQRGRKRKRPQYYKPS